MSGAARIPAIVLGGTGYVSGELLRLLAPHPHFVIAGILSDSQPGEPVAKSFRHLAPALGELCFQSQAGIESQRSGSWWCRMTWVIDSGGTISATRRRTCSKWCDSLPGSTSTRTSPSTIRYTLQRNGEFSWLPTQYTLCAGET